MINNLIKLSNKLDDLGFRREADLIDRLIKESAESSVGFEDAESQIATTHFVKESYPIGDGTYCQLKLSTGEHYIFICEDLPDFTPGAALSNDEVDEAYESGLLQGDGSYQIPDDFLRERGLVIRENSNVPAGAELITHAIDSDGARCYYKYNNEVFTISGDREMECEREWLAQ